MRKKKRQEIIAGKRKKTMETATKQRPQLQSSAEEHLKETVPEFLRTGLQVASAVAAMDAMVGVAGKEQELLVIVRGIRVLTVNEEPVEAFKALCDHPLTLEAVMKIIGQSTPDKTEL